MEANKSMLEIKTIVNGGDTVTINVNGELVTVHVLGLADKLNLLDISSTFVKLLRETMGEFRFQKLDYDPKTGAANLKDVDYVCVLTTLGRHEITTKILQLLASSMRKDVQWFFEKNLDPEHIWEIIKVVAELCKIGDLLPFLMGNNTTQKKETESKEVKKS